MDILKFLRQLNNIDVQRLIQDFEGARRYIENVKVTVECKIIFFALLFSQIRKRLSLRAHSMSTFYIDYFLCIEHLTNRLSLLL